MFGLIRRYGLRPLARDTVLRLRYGDGFSHARSLAFLLCLAVVPLLIAVTGLAEEIGAEKGGLVVAYVTLALTPGRSESLVRRLLLGDQQGGDTGEAALLVGLATAAVAMTSAMAQIERAANRLYGIRRDRPTLRKYGRALVLTLVAGVPAFAGFLMIVAGRAVGDALELVYGWGTPAERLWSVLHIPLALVLTVTAVAVLFRHTPRRGQPSLRWLLPGVVLATGLWLLVTLLLALYVNSGVSFNQVYGPLTAVMALLLWANGSGIALLSGLAWSAQLEACRAGQVAPCEPDR